MVVHADPDDLGRGMVFSILTRTNIESFDIFFVEVYYNQTRQMSFREVLSSNVTLLIFTMFG